MTDKDLYFMCCISRDRGIEPQYFDFEHRNEIEDFKEREVHDDDER